IEPPVGVGHFALGMFGSAASLLVPVRRLLDRPPALLHVLAEPFDGVARGKREGRRDDAEDVFHPGIPQLDCRMSTKWPAIAAAAAISGLTRCVRPPAPWRPSKLRFEVEAQRSPGESLSSFMPRHMEQPASRHSKPESLKTRSRPSFSAWALTRPEPGTTSASFTFFAMCLPRTIPAAARRSSMRELVHEPMKILSTAIPVIGVCGHRSTY